MEIHNLKYHFRLFHQRSFVKRKCKNPKYNFRFDIISGFYPDIDRSHHMSFLLIPQTAAHRGSVSIKRTFRRHSPRINYPKAFVVPKDEKPEKKRITKEILQICREELPDYMVPDEIEYRSELPRTPRGKVDYRALEEMAKDS